MVIIKLAHDSQWSNHLGINKTLKRIQTFFFWPDLRNSIADYIKSCSACQKQQRLLRMDKIPIKAIKHCQIPFFQMNLDLIGPIVPKSSRGHQYILSVMDNFSRWVECLPLKGLGAKEVCDGLISIFL